MTGLMSNLGLKR